MGRIHLGLLVAMVGVVALAAGCGSDPTATPTPTSPPVSGATPTPTPDAAARFQAEWDALIVAAQQEGELIIVMGGGGVPLNPVYDIFSEKFGIKVVTSVGSSRENGARVLAEQSAGRYTVDIIHSGLSSGLGVFMPNDSVQDVRPFLFHPEVIDETLWFGNKLWWADESERFFLVYEAQVAGQSGGDSLFWNKDLLGIDEVATWKTQLDVLGDAYKGQIITLSQAAGGSAGTNISKYLDPAFGPEWYERLFTEVDAIFTPDLNVVVDTIAQGGAMIAQNIGTAARTIRSLQTLGAPIEEYAQAFDRGELPGLPELRELGPVQTSGMLLIPKNPPHPNAMKLALNWLLSIEGQTAIHETEEPGSAPGTLHNEISLRRDVPPGLTDPKLRWEAGAEYAIVSLNPSLSPLNEIVSEWVRELERCQCKAPRPFDPEEYRAQMIQR